MATNSGKALGQAEKIMLADIARAYYLDGRSKIEIAADFSISRFRVAKLLEDARSGGIVTIEVRDPRSGQSELDKRVADALGIDHVRVIDADTKGANELSERLGLAVMDILKQLIRPHMTLGISWSRTLDAAARFLPELPPCDLVQLAGALQMSGSGMLPRMIAQLGNSPDTRTWPLYAPLVVDEKATADDLKRQPEIAEALQLAGKLDLAIVAIGAWRRDASTVWEKVSAADRRRADQAGAVAEVSGRLLDSAGQAVHTPLDERTIGVTIDQLVATKEVIAVAHDTDRAEAVRAVARSGIVSRLVIDSVLAETIAGPSED